MIATNYTQARANLKYYMDKARDNCEPVIITSKDGNVVLLSEEQYNNLEENMLIMSDPAMVEHLNKSISQLLKGEVVKTSLEELKKMEND